VTGALMALFTATFGQRPRFRVHGGTEPENLALQNVQVRSCASSCHGVRP
jgi:NAD+ synthase (glutamine-hydrolysing)